MDLRREILKENSRKQALKVAGWIGTDRKRFNQLLDIFLRDEFKAVQLSAHVLSFVADSHPELIRENIHVIFDRMFDDNIHGAVKRTVVRLLQFVDIPVDLHVKVINACMDYLSDPNEAIAVRCFSMTVLFNMSKQYPEIRNELGAVLNARLRDTKGGLKVRARDVLKELNRS